MIKHIDYRIAVILIISLVQYPVVASLAEAPPHDEHDHQQRSDPAANQERGDQELARDGGKAAEKETLHFEQGHREHNEVFMEFGWANAKQAGVRFVKVREAKIYGELKFYGETSLNGDKILHVVPRFPGTVQLVAKHLGESVEAGELLAKIQSNESLSSYDIKATLTGIIIEKDASLGEFVDNKDPIFVIASLENVWVNFAVFPHDLKRIQIGSPVVISSTLTGARQQGAVDYIRPTMTESTRTALARVVLNNPTAQWFPGMSVRVTLRLEPEVLPLGLPSESVILVNNKKSVFVKRTDKDGDEGFEVRPVQTGRSDSKTVEILSGVQAGEEVAANRTFILKAELGKGAAEHSH